jgi:pimeloyl-ACP methyl ester carboxylesterase
MTRRRSAHAPTPTAARAAGAPHPGLRRSVAPDCRRYQAHWVSLASSAQLISVGHTSHNIQLDRPDVVLDKIHELLQ